MALKLLLLPGLDGDGFYLGPLKALLSQHHSCMLLSYPKRQMDYEDLCAWAEGELDVESDYLIFAESFGGPLGIRLAEVLEEQAKGLILCSTFCEPPASRFSLSFLAALYPRIAHFSWMKNVLDYFLCNGRDRTIAEGIHRALLACPDAVIAQRIRLLRRLDMRAASASLTLPCLVINAARDRLVRYSRFSQLRVAEIKTIDGPHELAGTHVETMAQLVLSFVKTIVPDNTKS